ncbi:MAG: peptidylprolyl isomerase, partial [Hyphomicrobiales bacterium]|nr:peptidylprolyl isomerase [Hyphomicrobiales bacterium]
MIKRIFWFVATIAAFCVFGMAVRAEAADLENTIYLDLKDGRVVIELRDDLAPKHAARIKKLARAGFYDGLKFHRVIDGFMA